MAGDAAPRVAMTSTCLRCDWTGDATARSCPRCGADLFSTSEVPGDRTPPSPLRGRSPRLRWRDVVAIAAVVALAAAAIAFVQTHTPSTTASPAPTGGGAGYLVTTSRDGGTVRLWLWDLATSTATPGPVLPRLPDRLVFRPSVYGGWVGVTTSLPGVETAAILRFLGQQDHPTDVAQGRLVSWVPDSSSVNVLQARPLGGCRKQVTISAWFVSARTERPRDRHVVCGNVTGFGRDRTTPYLSVRNGGSSTIYRVGLDSFTPVLRGYDLLDVSSESDLLVTDGSHALFSVFSSGRPRPVAITAGRDPLLAERVLGWDAPATEAYVLGRAGAVHGVYRVRLGPIPRSHHATLLTATNAIDVQAAPLPDGDVYLSTDGAMRVMRDGELLPVQRPAGAPPPVGPLVWISTLSYSSPESP